MHRVACKKANLSHYVPYTEVINGTHSGENQVVLIMGDRAKNIQIVYSHNITDK
jgi:hypothetical protein